MLARKNNLMLLLGTVLVCAFLVTSLASYYVSRTSLRAQINTGELPLTSDNIYSEIQQDLLQPIFISSLMANDTFLRDWVLFGEEDVTQITRYLKEIKTKYGTFTSFFVSDRTSTYYHADGILKTVRKDEPRDLWYYRVRDMDDDYEINVDPDLANSDTMTIFINYKVFDYAGNFIGATGVGLTVSAVKNIIEDYQQRFDRTIYFVDPQGELALYGSRFDAIETNLHAAKELAPLAEQILSSESVTAQFQRNGKVIHLNTRFIPEFQWYLLVEQPEDRVVANIYNALLINLLICVVVVAVIMVVLHAAISGYQSRLEKVATVDKLTGAYNRLAFDVLFKKLIQETQRNSGRLSMLLFDIDHFKEINDSRGHLTGDRVLKDVATLVQSMIRKSDTLTRWGGDEFLVLLKDCSRESAAQMAEKIRSGIEDALSADAVTVSHGVALYDLKESGDSFLARADRALYLAKTQGRNRVEVASDEPVIP